ncbi:tRNA lysidine(34) synthetase TilS [Chitinimonas viridis]|uniref:tRNA(Ile)-lysidine synthase n=1 Tax=Chitinimonas viridis TaxID=664880 RepID=A0ABT8B1Q2_9NEIS|nr:tRNA lysidine(34) synthetase TilS [Chitinimonas viridis]MDN3576197.1 tRNA lysidine(34) synthetase TilS [Chitinimonas viridis]
MANSRKSPQAEAEALYERLQQRYLALPAAKRPEGMRLALGYSGGLDSAVLLHLLARLRDDARLPAPLTLQALHVHHGISPNADDWMQHCDQRCAALAVDFSHIRVDLKQAVGDSLEARARAARYAAYAGLGVDMVLLAHHRDDQAETVLYRLARGAGVHGAAGMPVMRPLGEAGRIWRPLLDEPRSVLLAYARTVGLAWVEDESNAVSDYDRNYLRREVMPVLLGRFPSAPAAMARAARHFAEAASLLDALAEEDAGGVVQRLPVGRLLALSGPRQRNLLRWFLARHGLRPDERQLLLVLEQMLTAKEDANPCLRLAGLEVHRYRAEICVARWVEVLTPRAVPAEGLVQLPDWCGELHWSRALRGLSEACCVGLEVRPRQGGEMVRPRRGGPNRPVKLLLQEAGVPPWLRRRWPMLWQGGKLVAVAGIAVAADCQSEGEGAWPDWRPLDWPDLLGDK